jgi:hypothetical protein
MPDRGVLGQFEEEFGCWVTDHGITFHTDDEHDRFAEVDLPALETGIAELVKAARDEAAGDRIVRYDEVRPGDQMLDGCGELSEVVEVDVYEDHLGISVRRGGDRVSYLDRQPDSLTAVRRPAAARPAARFSHADIDWWLPDMGRRLDRLAGEVAALRDPELHPGTPEYEAGYAEYLAWSGHTHVLSCGCPVPLPVRMAAGREVLCAGHGPVTIRTAPEAAG